jgi:acyl dehydratase
MGLVVGSAQEAVDAVGTSLGASGWLEIDQARIDAFAAATGDFQWIHVDPVRAKDGPFGKTIAHMFLPELFRAEARLGVNYGADRLRFPAPVPVGSRVRAVGELAKAEALADNAVQTTVRVTIEIEGGGKPGCVADILGRYYF